MIQNKNKLISSFERQNHFFPSSFICFFFFVLAFILQITSGKKRAKKLGRSDDRCPTFGGRTPLTPKGTSCCCRCRKKKEGGNRTKPPSRKHFGHFRWSRPCSTLSLGRVYDNRHAPIPTPSALLFFFLSLSFPSSSSSSLRVRVGEGIAAACARASLIHPGCCHRWKRER